MQKSCWGTHPERRALPFTKSAPIKRFYSAYYSLMNAAETYDQKGKKDKAKKYATLADDYKYQDEWMACREIPTALIEQATLYTRNMLFGGSNEKAVALPNPSYVLKDSSANPSALPESTKGCLPGFLQSLKACVLSDHEEKKNSECGKTSFGRWSY